MQTEINTSNYTNYAQIIMSEIKSMDSSSDTTLKELELQSQVVDIIANIQLKKEPRKKVINLLTYENTKNMSTLDVDKYFSKKSEEEKSHIKFMITISNNFSKNDIANKAIFEEVRYMIDVNERIDFSLGLALEKENFILGAPALHDVLVLSDEWIAYNDAGGENGAKKGIFMNEQHKARYEYGKTIKYNEKLLSQEEATDFLIMMLNIAKDNYKEAKGSELVDEHKDALDRYNRLYKTYKNELIKSI